MMSNKVFIYKLENIMGEFKDIYDPNIENLKDYSLENLESLYYSILALQNLFDVAFREKPLHLKDKRQEEIEIMRLKYLDRINDIKDGGLDPLDLKIKNATYLKEHQNL